MGTTHRDSSFKVKAEAVDSHFGVVPEPGALLYLKSDFKMIYADGYNWLDMGPGSQDKAAVAVELKTGYSLSFVAGVEKQVTFYDAQIYNYLTRFNPSGGNGISISAAFDVDYYAEYCLAADVQDVELTVTQKYNGTQMPRTIKLIQMNKFQTIQGFGIFTSVPPNTWTVWVKTNKNCTVSVDTIKLGMHERT